MANLSVRYGKQSYSLSEAFLNQLTAKGEDRVLNADEIAALAISAGPSEKKFLEQVLTDNTVIGLPALKGKLKDARKIRFDFEVLVDRKTLVGGAFLRRLNEKASDGVLGKSDFAALREGANADEQALLEGFRAYGIMGQHLPDAEGEFRAINFVVQVDKDLSPDLLGKLYTRALDGLLDAADFAHLRAGAVTEDDKAFLAHLESLNRYGNLAGINAKGQAEAIPEVLMHYTEALEIPGETPAEIVANIGQGDRIDATKTEDFRCGAGAAVNAVILSSGREGFARLASSFGLPGQLTYENVHRLQDAIYLAAGGILPEQVTEKQSTGLRLTTTYRGSKAVLAGTQVKAVELAGFKPEALRGESEIRDFFRQNPRSAMVAMVGRSDEATDFTPTVSNHAVLISWDKDKQAFMISDTYAGSGTGRNHRPLSEAETADLFASKSYSVGLTL